MSPATVVSVNVRQIVDSEIEHSIVMEDSRVIGINRDNGEIVWDKMVATTNDVMRRASVNPSPSTGLNSSTLSESTIVAFAARAVEHLIDNASNQEVPL